MITIIGIIIFVPLAIAYALGASRLSSFKKADATSEVKNEQLKPIEDTPEMLKEKYFRQILMPVYLSKKKYAYSRWEFGDRYMYHYRMKSGTVKLYDTSGTYVTRAYSKAEVYSLQRMTPPEDNEEISPEMEWISENIEHINRKKQKSKKMGRIDFSIDVDLPQESVEKVAELLSEKFGYMAKAESNMITINFQFDS